MSLYDVNVALHGSFATLSLVLGAFLLWGAKGRTAHRVGGWVWVVSMLITATTSFAIRDTGGFSWLHLLSTYTVFTVTSGLWAARQKNLVAHRGNMLGTYIGLSLAALGALDPERRIMQLLFP